MNLTLETSRDLKNWGHLDATSYTIPQSGSFKFTEDAGLASFYRLRKTGTSNLYVVGDSISTPGSWPLNLVDNLNGRHIFSQAIGGSQSPSMVNRARGVELSSPLTNPVTPGTIHMTWQRHIADRTNDNTYRSSWAACAKAVSEPYRIEVYQHGRFLGCATKSLKNFTTNYSSNTKTIYCTGHGLAAGDRVTFIGNDPSYPGNISVFDSAAAWNFSSSNLPGAIIERRVYFAANVTTNTFEIKEFSTDSTTLDIGGNASGTPSIECGWSYDVNFTGGTWDVTWKARTKYDDWTWLLEVSANDIPLVAVGDVTIPNTLLLLNQMIEINPRFILVCPPSGSFPDRGPGTFNWNNYYNTYMPWVRANYPDNYIDTMAIFEALRTTQEKNLLLDPLVPEHVWITGDPTNNATWVLYRVATTGATETWVGPGYMPLNYRASFTDNIHPNAAGNQVIADAVSAKINAKGW